MSKTIIATKCKDGWLVSIKKTKLCRTEEAVYNLAEKEGIKIKPSKTKILELYGSDLNN